MKPFLLFLFFILLTNRSEAFSTPNYPLRILVLENEFIFAGKVVKIVVSDTSKIQIARIAITDKIQGNTNLDTIDVGFNPTMSCPYDATFELNKTVIVFLTFTNGKFVNKSFGSGLKNLDDHGIQVYKNHIIEMQGILSIKDVHRQFYESLDWLIRCAENPLTQHEGLRELKEGSYFFEDYLEVCEHCEIKDLMNDVQRQKLKNIVLSATNKGYDYIAFEQLDLVYKGNETELNHFMINELKMLETEDYSQTFEFFNRLKHLNKSKEMRQLLRKHNRLWYEDRNSIEFASLIKDFIVLVEN